ncbi:MAG: alcohol dehydrogenase catalytic domain-containing protein, partial [Bacillota bacterium]|nr:alcohol dehydrogenase catalytic domain-containing protein [Bacillota bacterium]
MKTLQVTAPGQSHILDLPVPQPGPGQVLMRILAVTTCPQWDLHIRHNEPMFVGHQFHYPYAVGQPGHEAAGDIVAVGAGVTSLKPGDRVSAWKDAGHDRQGCYAQYVVHDADHVIKVPADLPLEAVA